MPSRVPLHVRQLRIGRLAGTDPGRARLTNAVAVTLAVMLAAAAAWLVVQYDVSDRGFLVVAIMATVQLGTSINAATARERLITTALSIFPLIAAPTVALLLDRWRYVEIAVFIVLAGVATWCRRFGPRAGQLGLVAFLAYFFALFLRPPLTEMFGFLLIFGCVWGASVLVRAVLLRERPVHQLSLLLAELRATGRTALKLALDADPAAEQTATLSTQLRRMDEVAKAISAWQHHFPTDQTIDCTADDLTARSLSARVDTEHAALEVAAVSRDDRAALAGPLADLDTVLSPHATADAVQAAAERSEQRLNTADDDTQLALTANLLARATLANLSLRELDLSRPRQTAPTPDADPPLVPAAPQTPADSAATDRAPAHRRFGWSWSSWTATDRLALQAMVAAGLAAIVGELIDASRWYWAVMAAFLIFVGATTRGAVLTKASHRVVGTLGGIAVGLVVGVLIDGPSPWHVALAVISVFGSLYFGPVKQFAGAFFSTLLLVAMYGLLGVLKPHILTVRLEETAAGAAVGVACAYLVFSASSRPALDAAITGYLDALRSLVQRVGAAFTSAEAPDLLSATDRIDTAQAGLIKQTGAMSLIFANGRWSRAAELKYLMTICTHSAERAAKAARSAPAPGTPGGLSPAGVDAFQTAVARVTTEAELANTALVDHGHPDVDADQTPILDQIPKIGLPPGSAAVQVLLMLSRVDGALVSAAGLRERN